MKRLFLIVGPSFVFSLFLGIFGLSYGMHLMLCALFGAAWGFALIGLYRREP
jgi:hypothetical protein